MPKTGTHSIAGLFERSFHAIHEPRYQQLIPSLEAKAEGRLAPGGIRELLRQRRYRLWLDLESCHILGQFAAELVEIFPRSLFILTVREPKSWLASLIDDQTYHYDDPGHRPWWRVYDAYFGPRGQDFPAQEKALSEARLYPLRQYLQYFNTTQRAILDAVPKERLLVVPTREISQSIDRIASFAGVSSTCLSPDKSHSYRRKHASGLLDRLDADYLDHLVAEETGVLMEDLWRRAEPTPTASAASATGGHGGQV